MNTILGTQKNLQQSLQNLAKNKWKNVDIS